LHYFSKSFHLPVFSALLGLAVLAPASALAQATTPRATGSTVQAPASAQAQTTAVRGKAIAAKPEFPSLRFNEMNNGENAIARLGANLPAAAAHYGKTPAEFTKQLRADRSAWIDKDGRMFYVEKALTTSGSNLAPSGAVYPLAETFLLHSRPGSKRKIYLDFNGHTTSGTAWNSSRGVSSIISPPFDSDGYPGTFNTAELSTVQNVWRRVAEDYAPFDIDVTTEEPPADQMVRFPWPSNDDTFGMRVVITKNITVGTSKFCDCGGVAYVGVFSETNESHKPAFAFYDQLGDEKSIAEAISHEVGHTLGLSHDGTATLTYYAGQDGASGATGWAPIMGVGYYRELVQFSKGEYIGANNKEDDFQVMQNNGVQFAADDFGNTSASATPLTGTLLNGISTYDARGLIETPSDQDVFKFIASAGTVTVNATPFELSPNLDIRLEVRNAGGVLLAESNLVGVLNASMTFSVPVAGTYYVTVQGVGQGVPSVNTYTDYGSIGRYSFRVTAPLTAGPPTCAIRATAFPIRGMVRVNFSGANSSDASGPIQSYQWDFGDGTGYTGVGVTHMYGEPGSYLAVLTVTNSAGQSSSCSYATDVEASGEPL
jgi:PKD repeat protein